MLQQPRKTEVWCEITVYFLTRWNFWMKFCNPKGCIYFSHGWFMTTIFSHSVMTLQVNCLARQTERSCNGEDKCTAVSQAEPDKNFKMFWCFWVLKKHAQSGFPNDKCFPGSLGWIYTPVVIFQLPLFTGQPALSYLFWNSILKKPKKVLFSTYIVTIFLMIL